MKALTHTAALLLLALPALASASCFFVYSGQNQLVYRSTRSPVDLSRPISEGLKGRFAGGHLVMIPDESACPDLLANGEAKLFASFGPGVLGSNRSSSAIDTSPLFKGLDPGAASRGGVSTSSDDGSDGDKAKPSGRRTQQSSSSSVLTPGK